MKLPNVFPHNTTKIPWRVTHKSKFLFLEELRCGCTVMVANNISSDFRFDILCDKTAKTTFGDRDLFNTRWFYVLCERNNSAEWLNGQYTLIIKIHSIQIIFKMFVFLFKCVLLSGIR